MGFMGSPNFLKQAVLLWVIYDTVKNVWKLRKVFLCIINGVLGVLEFIVRCSKF